MGDHLSVFWTRVIGYVKRGKGEGEGRGERERKESGKGEGQGRGRDGDVEVGVNISPVNSVAWAPHEYGLILACASSDGFISVLTYKGTFFPLSPFHGTR